MSRIQFSALDGDAAMEGRRQNYENPDKSLGGWTVHKCLRREAARLVHDIDKLFPRDFSKNGPTVRPCEVPKVASATGGKPGAVGVI